MKRFWDKVDVKGPDDCWEWQAGKDKDGYGHFRFNEKQQRAPRVAWQLKIGPIPDGMVICHACDNPPCVNPNHLFIGTMGDNINDMVKKGRHHFKSRTHCSKGHEYTEENIMWERGGTKRRCISCHRERSRIGVQKYRARRKEQECQK